MPVIDSALRRTEPSALETTNWRQNPSCRILSMQEIYIRLRHFMKSRNWKGTDCLSMSPFPEPQQTIFLQIQME